MHKHQTWTDDRLYRCKQTDKLRLDQNDGVADVKCQKTQEIRAVDGEQIQRTRGQFASIQTVVEAVKIDLMILRHQVQFLTQQDRYKFFELAAR